MNSIAPLPLIREAASMLTVELLVMIIGLTCIGVVLGCIPGVGPVLTMALFFPFTIPMESAAALILMGVLYGSTTYGGAISAILLNVPGTSGSTATLLDGFPMTEKGQGALALGLATLSSFIGAIIGIVMLFLFAPILARFTLAFGSPEFFALAVFGLTVVAVVSRGSMFKAFIAMSLGMFIASIGSDPQGGFARFSFDINYLAAGVDLIPLVVGLFAISQAIELAVSPTPVSKHGTLDKSVWKGVRETIKNKSEVFRGSLIGVSIGSIPGVGITAANFISYLAAQSLSDDPDSFGTGNPKGVIAAESSNNSAAMGSLIPAFALSIPGGAGAAVFISVMISKGVTPGPLLFDTAIPYAVLIGMLIGAIIFLIIGLFAAPYIAKVTVLPPDIVLSGIAVFALTGSLAIRNNILDVATAIAVGLLAFRMKRKGFSLVAFVMGFILSPIAEEGFRRSLAISGGDYSIFYTRPISVVLLGISIMILLSPILLRLHQKHRH